MIKNILRVAHSIVIALICVYMSSFSNYNIHFLVAVEVGLTIMRALIEHGLFSRNTKFQIIASLSLGYLLFPNLVRYISWVFFLKGIEAHKALKNVRRQAGILNGGEISKLLAFKFDLVRFSISQFIFLGFVSTIYKFFLDCRQDPIPDPHVIVYQLVVTASTIGYGDVTPKSRMQMIFFTYAVPILCSSFVIYINNIVELFTNTFLTEEPEVVEEQEIKEKTE